MSLRDDLVKGSAVTAGLMGMADFAYAAAADTIKVGLIGCGGRGTGAAVNCANAAPGIEIVALGDVFEDHLNDCKGKLKKEIPAAMKATDDRCFSGWDAYQKVIASGVDMVILATPPAFRPEHLKAAIDAGKHVFMEKPVAVDPVGIRAVIAAADMAQQKKLGIVAGTQRRHSKKYNEAIQRIHDGAIGKVLGGQVYWNQGSLWNNARKESWTDMEWQLRNWLYFTWLSGDHVVEQHVHNIDVANWVLKAHPVKAISMGGRQSRVQPEYGHIYDHFGAVLEYADGTRIQSMCRQIEGTTAHVYEWFQGEKGVSDANSLIKGATDWKFEGNETNPYQQEHTDLINSIRAGAPLNEGRQIAESTLSAIMVREAAYTGQELTWDQMMNSNLSLVPPTMTFGPLPVDQVPVPGVTKLDRGPWYEMKTTSR